MTSVRSPVSWDGPPRHFNFGCAWGGTYSAIANSTVYNTKIASFMCPSDGNAGKENICNYMASNGTISYNCCNNANWFAPGVFGYEFGASIADIEGGTSNTIAFSETLCSDPGAAIRPRGRGNSTGNIGSNNIANRTDITTVTNALALVKADAQRCTTKFVSPGGTGGGNGVRWGCGALGYSMFNTIMTPNMNKWSACRMDCCVQAQQPTTSRR